MNVNDVFPSKYLKASDLGQSNVVVTMSHSELEDVGQDGELKPVLYFKGKTKGLVLNKTNANAIASMYGPEMDNWSERQITLFATQTDFAGKIVPCIRVRLNAAMQAQAPVEPPMPPDNPAGPSDDDVPF